MTETTKPDRDDTVIDAVDETVDETVDDAVDDAVDTTPEASDAVAPHYGVGPFSIREVALGGAWLLALIVSFFPLYTGYVRTGSIWSAGIDWVLTIGVPTIAVFLIALRRLSPEGIRRVGSLGVDQVASVAFSVAAVLWLGIVWTSFEAGVTSWVAWIELVLFVAGVVLTVFAPVLPVLRDDFAQRPEVPAHRVARGARPVVARPVTERAPTAPVAPVEHTIVATDAPATQMPAAELSAETTLIADVSAETAEATPEIDPVLTPEVATDADDSMHALFEGSTADHSAAVATLFGDQSQPAPARATQPFWALSPVERDVVDDNGVPLFRVGPTAWALVVEDRGTSFVIRHDDGRTGYLNDVSGVTRG